MKYFKYLIFSIILTSCAFPRYSYNDERVQKLDFSKGEWLLNNVIAPQNLSERLSQEAIIRIKKFGCDSLTYIDKLRLTSPISFEIPFELDSDAYNDLKLITNADFLINIKTEILRDDLKNVMLSRPMGFSKSKAQTTIVIYDLKFKEKFYSQIVTGSLALDESDNNIGFAKSGRSLLLGSFNRGLKKLRNK